jgi:hypothetical protein
LELKFYGMLDAYRVSVMKNNLCDLLNAKLQV